VHLNGRVYDPLIGRMLSTDPFVPDPTNGQAWNRYSYVINNPLALTDPNGYCFLGMCTWVKAVSTFFNRSFGTLFREIPILGNLLEIVAVLLCPTTAGLTCTLPAAFASTTFVAGGNLGYALKASMIAAATATAFYEVGEITGHNPSFGSSRRGRRSTSMRSGSMPSRSSPAPPNGTTTSAPAAPWWLAEDECRPLPAGPAVRGGVLSADW
jgi:hypothetical protein